MKNIQLFKKKVGKERKGNKEQNGTHRKLLAG